MSSYLSGAGLYGYATSSGRNIGDFMKNVKTYHRAGMSGRPDLMLNDWIRMSPMLIPQYLEQSPEAQMVFSGEGYQDLVAPHIRSLLTGIRTTAKGQRASLAARGLGRSSLSTALGSELLGRGQEGVAALLTQARLTRFQQALNLRQGIAQLQAGLTTGVIPAMHREQPHGGSFWKSLGRSALTSFVGSAAGAMGGYVGSLGNPMGAAMGARQGQTMARNQMGSYGWGYGGLYSGGPM